MFARTVLVRMELHFRQNSIFVFGTRLAVFYATLYNATSNCVDFVVELFDCTWYFLFFTFNITKLAYQIDDFLLLWQKWPTTQLSTFDVVFSTSKFMYSASFDILPQSIERGHRGRS